MVSLKQATIFVEQKGVREAGRVNEQMDPADSISCPDVWLKITSYNTDDTIVLYCCFRDPMLTGLAGENGVALVVLKP